uniref:Replisome organizer n=2 Tax=unclassified Caudoviricetes TaxID=2788787 RepID=A0A8S5V3D2_9CAUD|nr:MAG TPA: replisome organizer [Myoviridae sp. ctk6V34]
MIELGKGWVPISRQLQDHWLWNDKPFSKGQAWIDLIMLANHEEVKKPYKNQIMTFERGTVSLSLLELSNRWGWSRHRVRDFLNTLKTDAMLDIKRTGKITAIVIENYAFYNDVQNAKGQKKDEKRTVCGQFADTNNNDNNDNNIYNNKNARARERFVAPTVDEVRAYCTERNNSVDAQRFVDYYTANGWMVGKNKMKNWQAAVRTWERQGTAENVHHPTRTQRRFCETPVADDLDDLF